MRPLGSGQEIDLHYAYEIIFDLATCAIRLNVKKQSFGGIFVQPVKHVDRQNISKVQYRKVLI